MITVSEERQLLTRIAAEDRAALSALYRLYFHRLERFVGRIAADRSMVEDIINEVFFVIWQKAGSFQGRSSPSTWILGIAYRKALKAVAREQRFAPLDPGLSSGERAESLAEQRDLERLLGRLSPEQRAVMELTYFFGYSYREIGEILECPENTVKTRMFHARRSLREHAREDLS